MGISNPAARKNEEGRVGDFFEHNGYKAYIYASWQDTASDNSNFPNWQLVEDLIVTDEKWIDDTPKSKNTKSVNEHQDSRFEYDHDRQTWYDPNDYGGFPSHW